MNSVWCLWVMCAQGYKRTGVTPPHSYIGTLMCCSDQSSICITGKSKLNKLPRFVTVLFHKAIHASTLRLIGCMSFMPNINWPEIWRNYVTGIKLNFIYVWTNVKLCLLE